MKQSGNSSPETRGGFRRFQRRIVIMVVIQTIIIVGAIKFTPGPFCTDFKTMIAADSGFAFLRGLGCR